MRLTGGERGNIGEGLRKGSLFKFFIRTHSNLGYLELFGGRKDLRGVPFGIKWLTFSQETFKNFTKFPLRFGDPGSLQNFGRNL